MVLNGDFSFEWMGWNKRFGAPQRASRAWESVIIYSQVVQHVGLNGDFSFEWMEWDERFGPLQRPGRA